MCESSSAAPPESVQVVRDPASGLDGVIVLHSTRLGPAAGGCRLWRYADGAEMAKDAVRLAEGMAYKNAIAGLPLGGGKAVLRIPAGPFDRRRLFQAFGREVARLEGAYVTAEDVGTTVADMQAVSETCRHVAGLQAVAGRPGGDPSPWTALGVFLAMREAARRKFGSDLKGMTVAVQGLGSVGSRLCALLHDAGANLVVAEPRSGVAAAVACRYGATVAGLDSVLDAKCEIFAPCALGAVIDERSIARLRARIVCGAANNVLATARTAIAWRIAACSMRPTTSSMPAASSTWRPNTSAGASRRPRAGCGRPTGASPKCSISPNGRALRRIGRRTRSRASVSRRG
jgi:leucine dehydrogenase